MKWIRTLALCSILFVLPSTVLADEEVYTELSVEEKHRILTETALDYDIPPEILKAIAFEENGLMQFDEEGKVVVSEDGGIGMMQVTNTDFKVDEERLKTDTAYNIEIGARVLDSKWDLMASGKIPTINGADNRKILEQWYFPIMAYNGVANRNNPDKESDTPTYQETIYKVIKDNSRVTTADVPKKFSFGIGDDEKLKFNDLSYEWEEADTLSTQMFDEGDHVFVMNDEERVSDFEFGRLKGEDYFSSREGSERRVPYYTAISIVGKPMYPKNNINNHYIAYPVEGVDVSGTMASANLRDDEMRDTDFNAYGTQETVDMDKEWKIEMSTTMLERSVQERNIYIVRDDGVGVASRVELQDDWKTITIEPDHGFVPGASYRLYVKDLISTTRGDMEDNVVKTFTIKASKVQDTIQKGDLEFHIEANKQTFSGDDQVKVTASVENVGQQDIVHHGSSSCDSELYISIQKNDERQDFVGEGDKERWACTTDWEKFELVPGEKMRAQATFDLLLHDFEQEMKERPESGQYVIVARYGDQTMELPITIE